MSQDIDDRTKVPLFMVLAAAWAVGVVLVAVVMWAMGIGEKANAGVQAMEEVKGMRPTLTAIDDKLVDLRIQVIKLQEQVRLIQKHKGE